MCNQACFRDKYIKLHAIYVYCCDSNRRAGTLIDITFIEVTSTWLQMKRLLHLQVAEIQIFHSYIFALKVYQAILIGIFTASGGFSNLMRIFRFVSFHRKTVQARKYTVTLHLLGQNKQNDRNILMRRIIALNIHVVILILSHCQKPSVDQLQNTSKHFKNNGLMQK